MCSSTANFVASKNLRGRALCSNALLQCAAGMEQVADAAAAGLAAAGLSPQQQGSQQSSQQPALRPHPCSWLSQLGSVVRGGERQAYVVYTVFFAVFVADFSMLTLAYPLSLLGYALLSPKPRRQYWQVSWAQDVFNRYQTLMPAECRTGIASSVGTLHGIGKLTLLSCYRAQAVLMYTEVVLIAQYVWQIPTRLNCVWVSLLLRTQMEEVRFCLATRARVTMCSCPSWVAHCLRCAIAMSRWGCTRWQCGACRCSCCTWAHSCTPTLWPTSRYVVAAQCFEQSPPRGL